MLNKEIYRKAKKHLCKGIKSAGKGFTFDEFRDSLECGEKKAYSVLKEMISDREIRVIHVNAKDIIGRQLTRSMYAFVK